MDNNHTDYKKVFSNIIFWLAIFLLLAFSVFAKLYMGICNMRGPMYSDLDGCLFYGTYLTMPLIALDALGFVYTIFLQRKNVAILTVVLSYLGVFLGMFIISVWIVPPREPAQVDTQQKEKMVEEQKKFERKEEHLNDLLSTFELDEE
jgi:hypothetical protein